MSVKINSRPQALVVAPTHRRETPQPRVTFRKVLDGGAQLLAAGARVATRIVGGPFLSAAVTNNPATQMAANGALQSIASSSGGSVAGGSAGNLPGLGGGPLGVDNGTQNPLSPYIQNQNQNMNEDLQLLALQDQIQRNNRQIALVSNVMKARHDTAKSAISNIRS
jgi:hypothetical protein